MTTARCNPLWQPIPCPLYDIEGPESWLGDMAAQGLVPVTIGQNFARFRCSQPKAVRYRLNAKPAPETFLESAPGTPDGEERALAQECGWYYVTAVGDFFLYACDSDAPELNTDPQVQALSLRYAKRHVFAPAGLLAYWLVTFWVRYAMGVWHTPVIDFVELGWLSFCYLGLLAAALVSVVHNTVLLYRFSARLTRGAEPERHKNWRKGAGRYLVGRVLAALLAQAALFAPVLLQCLACALAFAAAGILAGATGQRQCAQLCRLYFEGARLCGSMLVLYFFMIFLSTALLLLAGNGGLG